jgi:hypothetical protein
MKKTLDSFCFLLLLCSLGVAAFAQRPSSAIERPRSFPAEVHPAIPAIFVGQTLFDAQTALQAQNIQASKLAKPFPLLNAELSALAFTLDLDHVGAYAFYHKTTQKIVGLTILFKPFGDADKSTETHVAAQSLRWNPDRTYEIRFEPPADPEFAKPAAAAKLYRGKRWPRRSGRCRN